MKSSNTLMLGQSLRAERIALGLKQQDIADRTGYTRARISAAENGANITARMLFAYLMSVGKCIDFVPLAGGLEALADVLEPDDSE